MYYDPKKMRAFVSAVMERTGLSREKSELFAESLVRADLRGMKSHGVTRLKTYAYRLEAGLVDAKAEPEVLRDNPALILMDGKNALGVPSAMRAMELCVDHAEKSGACFAAVRGGNHFGIGEFYTDYAARHDMIGFAAANAPKALAPIGGREPLLGTNPLSVSIPAGRYPNMNLDMATSIVARGKVTLAKKNGEAIPEGWGIDENGAPTTDPNQLKCMLPFGGYKGYAIGLIIEILCSCLSGAATGLTMGSFYDFSGTVQNSGFFLGAINVAAIMDPADFRAEVDKLFDSVKAIPLAEGCEQIYLPGEIELNKAALAEERGVEISDAVAAELREVSEKYGVPFSCEMQR